MEKFEVTKLKWFRGKLNFPIEEIVKIIDRFGREMDSKMKLRKNSYRDDYSVNEDCIKEMANDKSIRVYITTIDSQIVGFVKISDHYLKHTIHLDSIYVLPKFRGGGAGGNLFNTIKTLEKKYDPKLKGIHLMCVPSLVKWYNSHGFETIEHHMSMEI